MGTWGFIGTSEHPSEHYLVIEKSKNSNSYELTQYHLYEHSYPDWKNKTRIYQKESSKEIHHLTENKDKLEFTPGGYFYIDNDTIVPISIGVSTLYTEVIFGLYGDEASGIKFTKESTQRLIGDNKFYFIYNKFQKINK